MVVRKLLIFLLLSQTGCFLSSSLVQLELASSDIDLTQIELNNAKIETLPNEVKYNQNVTDIKIKGDFQRLQSAFLSASSECTSAHTNVSFQLKTQTELSFQANTPLTDGEHRFYLGYTNEKGEIKCWSQQIVVKIKSTIEDFKYSIESYKPLYADANPKIVIKKPGLS